MQTAPPNLLADYLYLRQTAVVKQAIDTARTSVPSGGHSSSYLCQQDSVFAAQDRRLAVVADPELLGRGLYASAGRHKKIDAPPLGMEADAALDLLVRSRPPASRHASQPAQARGDGHSLQHTSRTHDIGTQPLARQ